MENIPLKPLKPLVPLWYEFQLDPTKEIIYLHVYYNVFSFNGKEFPIGSVSSDLKYEIQKDNSFKRFGRKELDNYSIKERSSMELHGTFGAVINRDLTTQEIQDLKRLISQSDFCIENSLMVTFLEDTIKIVYRDGSFEFPICMVHKKSGEWTLVRYNESANPPGSGFYETIEGTYFIDMVNDVCRFQIKRCD